MKLDSKYAHLIDIFEVLCLSIPTLFKIMSTRENGAIELAIKGGQIFEQFPNDQRLNILKSKLNLFLAAIYLSNKSDAAKSYPLANIQIDVAHEQGEKIQDERMRKAISSEIAFAKSTYFYKGYKKNCLKGEFANKSILYEELKRQLTKADSLLDDSENFKVCKAKIALLRIKYRDKYNKRNLEKEMLENIKEANQILRSYGAQRLIMKANYAYASLRLE